MQFLKLLFWFLLAFVAALFTFGNWTNVSIQLFGGLVMEVNLPLLLLAAFLLGCLPTLAWQSLKRWRLRQRLSAAERALESERALAQAREATPVATTLPALAPGDLPSDPA